MPATGVGPGRAVLVEAVATFVLLLVALAAVDHGPPALVAPAVGLGLAVVIVAAAPLTGGAVNPARAFGPDLLDGRAGVLWIYLLGPIAGGAVSAVVYRGLASARRPETQQC